MNRRQFASVIGGASAASLAAQQPAPPPQTKPAPGAPNPNTSEHRGGTMKEVPPFGETISFTRSDVKPKVEPCPMTQVKILSGPCAKAAEWNRGYMQRLEA